MSKVGGWKQKIIHKDTLQVEYNNYVFFYAHVFGTLEFFYAHVFGTLGM